MALRIGVAHAKDVVAEYDLKITGYRAVIVVSFGYHADDDFNAALPKSRLEENVIFSRA